VKEGEFTFMANTSRITSTSMDWFKVAEEAYEYASQLLPEISQSKLNIISDTAKKNLAIQFNDIEHPIVEALLSKKKLVGLLGTLI
jgi:hypothetical protein